jgi:hypothetical protein
LGDQLTIFGDLFVFEGGGEFLLGDQLTIFGDLFVFEGEFFAGEKLNLLGDQFEGGGEFLLGDQLTIFGDLFVFEGEFFAGEKLNLLGDQFEGGGEFVVKVCSPGIRPFFKSLFPYTPRRSDTTHFFPTFDLREAKVSSLWAIVGSIFPSLIKRVRSL